MQKFFTRSCRPWRLSGAAPASIFIAHHLIWFLGLQKSSLAWRNVAQQGIAGRVVICLLKAQRPDMGTADSQVSHFMSGEHFDVCSLMSRFLERWQSFCQLWQICWRGFTYWGLALICQGCRLLNCIHLLCSFAFHTVTLRYPEEKFCSIPTVPSFPIRRYLGVIFQFRGAQTGLLDLVTPRSRNWCQVQLL